MAKFTVEKWRCDRCHRVEDRWLKPGSSHAIVVAVDHGTAGGTVVEWREMCVTCNEAVSEQVEAMRQSALAVRSLIQSQENGK